MRNVDKASEVRGPSQGCHAKTFRVYLRSHNTARTRVKADSEVTRCPSHRAVFGFRVQSPFLLSESILSRDARLCLDLQGEENPYPTATVWAPISEPPFTWS